MTAEHPVVEAVVVNHQTSLSSTLALRSLAECRTPEFDLRITVADNHSSDPDIDGLRAAAGEVDADFTQTRWPADRASVNTHAASRGISCSPIRTPTISFSSTAISTSRIPRPYA